MTTCLMIDEGADFGAAASGRTHGGCETVDLDYFLRRPRAAAIGHWGIEGQALFGALGLRFSIGEAGGFKARHADAAPRHAGSAAVLR
jgi:hypothetical protein